MRNLLAPVSRLSVATLLSLTGIALPYGAMAQVQFSAPPMSAPGNREAGAVRSDSCAETTGRSGLMAVLPNTNVGVTTAAFPTLFAYVPPNNAARAELMVLNEATGEEVFRDDVTLPSANSEDYAYGAAVVGFAPGEESTLTLNAGESYLWALMLICNADNRAEDIVITGVVQRADQTYLDSLEPDVKDSLAAIASAPEQEQVEIYGEAGLWHDLVTKLAHLAQTQPETYQDDWVALLDTQGLGAIANVPVVFSPLTQTP